PRRPDPPAAPDRSAAGRRARSSGALPDHHGTVSGGGAVTLAPPDFAFVSHLVRQRSAIDLPPGKEYLVESRLAPLARAVGESDVAGVVARLRQGDDLVTDLVLDAMTT